jgi:hypothetical protein
MSDINDRNLWMFIACLSVFMLILSMFPTEINCEKCCSDVSIYQDSLWMDDEIMSAHWYMTECVNTCKC